MPRPGPPGTQALSFEVLRRLGTAAALRARLAPKPPAPALDALLLSAIALLLPDDPAEAPGQAVSDGAEGAALGSVPTPPQIPAKPPAPPPAMPPTPWSTRR